MKKYRDMCFVTLVVGLCWFTSGVSGTLYLVRHAEKETGDDPNLSVQGRQRALDLAVLLQDAEITRVYSTDFRRTRQTAQPLATVSNLEVEIYDPREIITFIARLRSLTGTALVVGHSNTIPSLVHALGGRATPIPEWDYDRVYRVDIEDSELRSSTLLHLPPKSTEPPLSVKPTD